MLLFRLQDISHSPLWQLFLHSGWNYFNRINPDIPWFQKRVSQAFSKCSRVEITILLQKSLQSFMDGDRKHKFIFFKTVKPRAISNPSIRIETNRQPFVGITYTGASGRKPSRFIRKINKRFAGGADVNIPLYFNSIEIRDLYLLVYAWKLGFNPTHLEFLHNQEEEVRAGILEYEKTLQNSTSSRENSNAVSMTTDDQKLLK